MKREGEEWSGCQRRFLAACGEDQEKVSLPQPVGIRGRADIHSAASGDPMPQQGTSSEGDCSPETAHGEEPMLTQVFWQDL